MSFETLAEYLALAACVVLSLTLIGLPLRVGLRSLGREPLKIPTPLLGMGVVVVGGWYWYGPFGGLRPMFHILVGVGAITAAVIALRERRMWRRSLETCLRDLALPTMVAVGVGLVLIFSWGSILAQPYPTNITGGNNDIVSYALLGQHVADQGPDQSGSIEGYDAGARSQSSFDFGAVAIVAAAATGPFEDVWRYQHPLMGVAVGLIAYVLARLLDDLAPGHTVLAALAGVASICPILLAYLWSNYFLNEVLAISLVLAACVSIVHGASRSTIRARVAHGLAAAAVLAPLFASYPHMAFVGPIVIVPALFAAHGITQVWTRSLALIVQGVGALVAAFVLLPMPAWRIPDTVRYLGNVEAGWPFPGYLPAEILGFVSTMSPRHDAFAEWLPSLAILIGLVAVALWAVRSNQAPMVGRFAIGAFALALLSYWYVFESQGGPSYRQWKWITFFTPVLVATAVFLTTLAVASAVRRYTRNAEGIAAATGVAYCVLAVSNSGSVGFGIGRSLSPVEQVTPDLSTLQQVTPDLSALEHNPVVQEVDALNIDLAPYWETMWAAYFLRDHERLRLVQPSYYPAAPPAPGWTLQRRDAPLTPDVLEVHLVNDTYQLVRR